MTPVPVMLSTPVSVSREYRVCGPQAPSYTVANADHTGSSIANHIKKCLFFMSFPFFFIARAYLPARVLVYRTSPDSTDYKKRMTWEVCTSRSSHIQAFALPPFQNGQRNQLTSTRYYVKYAMAYKRHPCIREISHVNIHFAIRSKIVSIL